MPVTIYLLLVSAVVFEVIGTSALKASDGFTRLGPSLLTACAYALAFYLLSLTLRAMPVGIAYALWSALGVVLITLIGWIYYRQVLDGPAILGLAMIVAGVVVINLFSKTVTH
jgi:small multidrug resistance pump